MRVGILGLLQESNTFIARPTTIEHFRQDVLVCGAAVRERFAAAHHELGGFFAGLEAARIDAVPLFAARAYPFGTITADAWDELLGRMFDELDRAGQLDGVLVAPHGATVSELYPDADGHWLGDLRRRVGPALPILGTLDSHANLSAEMVCACNALVAYRTNPHLDQRQRGIEAATLMARTLRGEIHPTMAAAFPPLAINIERQQTDEPHFRPLWDLAAGQLARPGVLSNSVLLGFPYADVAKMGSSTIVVTDNQPDLARQLADELADYLVVHREDFDGRLIGIAAALDRAATSAGPVGLLDMGDNIGGGSPGDSTFLAHAIHQRRLPCSFVCLNDPDSVARIEAALRDIDNAQSPLRLTLSMGGKTDTHHGAPLTAEVTVLSLHDGVFEEPQARHGGITRYDQGRTALVRTDDDLTVMLTSRRVPPFSLRQLTSCGIDPASFHLLAIKGANAPIAAYAPVCRELIKVNTPGCTTANMHDLPFTRRRRPMFPFER